MTIDFYKTGEMNSSSYVKIILRSSAVLNIQNDGEYCFIRSVLAHLLSYSRFKKWSSINSFKL